MWKAIQRAYYRLCKRFGPAGLTVSAWAWLRLMQGKPWLANRVDGLWLLFGGQRDHCLHQFRRESA